MKFVYLMWLFVGSMSLYVLLGLLCYVYCRSLLLRLVVLSIVVLLSIGTIKWYIDWLFNVI